MFKYFARIVLDKLEIALDKIADNDAMLKSIAARINARINIPKLDEQQEGELIYTNLKNAINSVRVLLDLVKI